METTKKIIGLGVITGVVVFAFLRSFGKKGNHQLTGTEKPEIQLV